jgi:glycosyltransferase involved in cell wall biosynthesis
MPRPLVSVLICTYNAESTIHWALQSVLDQTYDNLEVLILDNNSKDSTVKLLDEYKLKDNRVKIFTLEKNL